MKKLKNGTATVREYINITIQRIQLAGTHCTTKAINTFAQVYGIVAHYKAVVFIQVEHGFFENKGRNFPQFKKHGGFRMVTKKLDIKKAKKNHTALNNEFDMVLFMFISYNL